jgi:hypothetical protein
MESGDPSAGFPFPESSLTSQKFVIQGLDLVPIVSSEVVS